MNEAEVIRTIREHLEGQFFPSSDPTAEAALWHETISGINRVSPDGHWLAISHRFTPWVRVYQLPECEPVATLTNHANVGTFEFSPVGDALAVCSSHRVELWNTSTWARSQDLTNSMNLIFSGVRNVCWLTRDFRHAELCDSRTLATVLPLPNGTLPLALSRDGRYLAVSVDARFVRLWDLDRVRREFQALGIDWQNQD